MSFVWSDYQNAIFDWTVNDKGNGQVIAPAGSAKTTTGIESVKRIPKKGFGLMPDVVYLAFNKHIQIELGAKLPEWAKSQTYHAFGLTAIRNFIKPLKIDQYKNFDILDAHYGKEKKILFPIINRITGLFKGNLATYDFKTLWDYVDYYGIDLGDEGYNEIETVAKGVELLLDPSHVQRLGKVDFDDMIWYPVVQDLPMPKYDWILVDELQDTNDAQFDLVIRSINGSGRIMGIGDPNQSIYAWRGAGIDMMEKMKNRLNAIKLPLSITYRCPLAVVRLVNQEFPDIPFEPWDQAEEGAVNTLSNQKAHEAYLPGDMVLCRLNAPLVAPALALLREGRKAIIKGRDIGENLLSLIRKVEKQFYPASLEDFVSDLDFYVDRECEKLLKREQYNQANLLEDKQETIMAFADGCETLPEMKSVIEQIFAENTEGVTFSTVHKAKGLEANNVYILHPEMLPFKRAKNEWQIAQELNLKYVAYTRAKQTLNFVEN